MSCKAVLCPSTASKVPGVLRVACCEKLEKHLFLISHFNAYRWSEIELWTTLINMVKTSLQYYCANLSAVNCFKSRSLSHVVCTVKRYSFQTITLRAWRTMRFPFCATERLKITQLFLSRFVDPSVYKALHFWGRKLVNEICKFLRAASLKTLVT